MGIDKFMRSLELTRKIGDNSIYCGFKEKIATDYFYDDFNSTIYNVANTIEKEINYLLYAIILCENGRELSEEAYIYAKRWNFDISKSSSIVDYKSHFTSSLIDNMAIKMIEENQIYKCEKLLDSIKLKKMFISFDGVPEFGKKGEQHKRRANSVVVSEIKKKIYRECENEIPEMRKIYEINKISYDRGKIISWTTFMESVEKLFKSEIFLNKIKSVCPNLEEIIISDQNVCGEGEKKIMEHIIETKAQGSYTFFSPDADAIMLGLIAQNELNNKSKFTILRFNQQTEEYDIVKIDVLSENIFKYVRDKIGIKLNAITLESVTNDIAFIFTVFGNDFLPKVDSIDVRNDIETILDIYCSVIKKAQKKYLIYKDKNSGKNKINYWNFAELFKTIASNESSMLNETYLSNKYSNYTYLKKLIGVNKLLPTIKNYIVMANELFKLLRNLSDKNDGKYIDQIAENYIKKNTPEIKKFMEEFLIFECNNVKRNENGEIENLHEKFKNQLHKIMTYFLNEKTKSSNVVIRGKQIFKINKFNPDGNTIKKRIIESFPHPEIEVTKYDIESYMFDRKLGKYESKLNAQDFEIGAIKISHDSEGNYVIKHFYRNENIAQYYDTFFGMSYQIKELKVKNGINKKIIMFDESRVTQLVEDYIKGIFWVFDCYFNKYNSSYNSNYVSTWIYPHHRSPLMYQVRDILYKFSSNENDIQGINIKGFVNKMNSLYHSVTTSSDHIVPRNLYMNKIEHYLYVTPYNRHVDIPEKYKEFVENNRDIYPNLSHIADEIWKGTDNSHLIDCRRISFVNKCNLLAVKPLGFSDFMQRIMFLRDDSNNIVIGKNFVKSFENNHFEDNNKEICNKKNIKDPETYDEIDGEIIVYNPKERKKIITENYLTIYKKLYGETNNIIYLTNIALNSEPTVGV